MSIFNSHSEVLEVANYFDHYSIRTKRIIYQESRHFVGTEQNLYAVIYKKLEIGLDLRKIVKV